MKSVDDSIKRALEAFVGQIRRTGWWGKEREAISYFAFGFLAAECANGAQLADPAQIGIEVRVPRPRAGGNVKAEITKDLVIWPAPGQTCWEGPWRANPESTRFPMAVMQWKVGDGCVYAGDVDWLTALTTDCAQCRGFALCLDFAPLHLVCDRIVEGRAEARWLDLR